MRHESISVIILIQRKQSAKYTDIESGYPGNNSTIKRKDIKPVNREIGMEITIGELFHAVFKRWVILLIAAVLCASAGGAFGYVRSSSQAGNQEELTQISAQEQSWYDENLEMTKEYSPLANETLVNLRREWIRLGHIYMDHPLMKLNPGECEWENISILFEDKTGHHTGTIQNWIEAADETTLFGTATDTLSQYKSDLIDIIDQEGETLIRLIGAEGWDTGSAAEYLKSVLTEQSQKTGVPISTITIAHKKGHLTKIDEFRVNTANMMNLVQGSITNTNSIVASFPAPIPPSSTGESGISYKSVIKYAVVGFVLGLIIGFCIVLFRLLRRGCLISKRQVESTFDLELLGDMADGSDSVAVLNANLDVMVGSDGRVMLLGIGEGVDAASIASGWNSDSHREYISGRDLIDDPETIDALQDTEGIVLGIRIGETRVADINRLLFRAGKLGKQVLGWISV